MGYLSLGITYDTINNYKIAIENYELALEVDPHYPDIWNNLGISYYKDNDKHKSIQCLNKAIELNPYYANPYNNLGFIMIGTDNNKTRELFLKSIDLASDLILKSESYAGLSLIDYLEENEDVASINKKNAIKLNPQLLDPDYLRIELGWQEQWVESFLNI